METAICQFAPSCAFLFTICAAVVNRNPRDRFLRTDPVGFSFPVFLFQALVPLLCFLPQIIGSQYLPLSAGFAQIQVCHFFREVSLRIKSKVLRNKPLPQTRFVGQVDLLHFIAWQLMGGVDLPPARTIPAPALRWLPSCIATS